MDPPFVPCSCRTDLLIQIYSNKIAIACVLEDSNLTLKKMGKLMKTQVRAKCAVGGGRLQRLSSVVASVSRPQVTDRRVEDRIDRPEISFKISSLVGQAVIAGALVFGGVCVL